MVKRNYKEKMADGLGEIFGEIYKDLKKDVLSKIPQYKTRLMKELLLAQKRILNEKVAIIGPPAVGKTSLLKVLKSPNIEKSEILKYEKTESSPYEPFKVKWNVSVGNNYQIDFNFKVAAGIDNGGEDYIREGHWLETIKQSGIIFYVFDFERFNSVQDRDKTTARIMKDFDWIAENVNALQSNFSIVLLGNKADVFCESLQEFRKLSVDSMPILEELHSNITARMPKGYSDSIKRPVLVSLLDKRIRNEQFSDLMLAVIGKNLVDMIVECNEMDNKAS